MSPKSKTVAQYCDPCHLRQCENSEIEQFICRIEPCGLWSYD